VNRALSVVLALVLAVFAGCSREERVKPASEIFAPARVCEAYIALLEKPDAARALFIGREAQALMPYFTRAGVKSFTQPVGRFDLVVIACDGMSEDSCRRALDYLSENGVMAWLMDVDGVTARDFHRRLDAFRLPQVHCWMPGETRWMLTGRKVPRRIKLTSVMELFLREGTEGDLAKAGFGTLPEIFANYVGTREEVLPAFEAGDADAVVRPEYFLTRQIPAVSWLSVEGVETDVARQTAAEIRSMQVIRRLVVEGNMLSARATDRKGEEAAIDRWSRAAKRNPHDLFLQARLDRLSRTARAFLDAKQVLQAMKCYETMVLVRPTPEAVNNFGMCLKMIGKKDLSDQVLKRAQELMKGEGR